MNFDINSLTQEEIETVALCCAFQKSMLEVTLREDCSEHSKKDIENVEKHCERLDSILFKFKQHQEVLKCTN